jgi:acetyltransferase-like isoleucine patch superfamily enzyme
MNQQTIEKRGVLLKKGKNVFIEPTAILIGDNLIAIGDNSRIGSYSNLRPVDHKIIIGKDVQIAQLVSIIPDSHRYEDVTKSKLEQGHFGADIIIEDDVWIGCNSVILHGVVIRKGSIVAAGAVVTRSVPRYCIVAGAPAKIIKRYSFKKNKWLNYSKINKIMFYLAHARYVLSLKIKKTV